MWKLLAVLASLMATISAVTFKNCGNPIVKIHLSMATFPKVISLKAGSKYSFQATYDVAKDVADSKSVLKVTLKKHLFWSQWLTIPCVDGKIGSCTITNLDCNAVKQFLPSECPPKKGHGKAATLSLPPIEANLPNFLVSGTYQFQAVLTSDRGEQLACIEMHDVKVSL